MKKHDLSMLKILDGLTAGDKSGEGSEMTPEWHRVLTSLRVWAPQQAISFLSWIQWGAFEDFMLGNETDSGSCSDMSSLFDALKKKSNCRI